MKEQLWLEGWLSFWFVSWELLAWGAVIALLPAAAVWVALPAAVFLAGGPPGYVRFPTADRQRWWILLLLTSVVTAIYLVIAPAAAIRLMQSPVPAVLRTGAAILVSFSFVVIIFKGVGHWRRLSQRAALPHLVRFDDEMRPLNGRVVNLDVGALAPRLDAVSKVLLTWARKVDATPTAKLWHEASGGEQARDLRGLAWIDVETLRASLSSLIQTDHSSVYFYPSTTRALGVALEAIGGYDSIVTTDVEHPSEGLLFDIHHHRRGIPIRRADVLAHLTESRIADAARTIVTSVPETGMPVVVISHVPYCMGVRMPIKDIVRGIRAQNPKATVIVDGAHAIGHFEVNLSATDFDIYLFSGHKWLYGPASLGILVLGGNTRPNTLLLDRLARESYESLSVPGRKLGDAGSTIALEPFVGLAEFVSKILDHGTRAHVFENITNARILLEAQVDKSQHVMALQFARDAEGLAAGIVNLQGKKRLLGPDALSQVCDILENDFQVVAKFIEAPPSVRLCLPFYLTQHELDYALNAIERAFAKVSASTLSGVARTKSSDAVQPT